MASTSLTEVLRETLALFEGSGEPRTTTEVADQLDIGRRSTYERLDRLVDHGCLETKKVGGNGRVWWQPPANADGTIDEPAVDVTGEIRDALWDRATVEFDLRTSAGGTVRVESRFSLVDGDGETSFTGVGDATERTQHERERERQRERLVAINNLNEVVRDIIEAVIEQSTREEIEATVCERLAGADSYEFAWIGEVDPRSKSFTPCHEAGVEGYLDEIPISTDADDSAGRGPAGRAVRTKEVQVTQDVFTDPEWESWREYAREYDYRSTAVIPRQ